MVGAALLFRVTTERSGRKVLRTILRFFSGTRLSSAVVTSIRRERDPPNNSRSARCTTSLSAMIARASFSRPCAMSMSGWTQLS